MNLESKSFWIMTLLDTLNDLAMVKPFTKSKYPQRQKKKQAIHNLLVL